MSTEIEVRTRKMTKWNKFNILYLLRDEKERVVIVI